ncbi:hypothetical protein LCGC14_0926070 [marine sediment metagenome]|uniref:Uncharacterized protein n=2 Tax=root TaxID=1 RepID=A0A831QN85_9FLAO|nr:hypothetical protein [Pricia sp.]HEA20007.1 hypothetical protein [Pricia antarctica]
MINENQNIHNKKNEGSLENDVQQNRGMAENYNKNTFDEKQVEDMNSVDNGGVESTNLEPGLQEQWLGVRDEYLANYPDLDNIETDEENGDFSTFIDRLAERRQRSTKEIQDEIMNWTLPTKN